jgi:hypothetical protein
MVTVGATGSVATAVLIMVIDSVTPSLSCCGTGKIVAALSELIHVRDKSP